MGSPEILNALRRVFPVVAVRGNVDRGEWAKALPTNEVLETSFGSIYMLHILEDLTINPAVTGMQIVVSGHSHKPGQSMKAGVLYVNPGSAGPRRFQLPVTVARLDLRVTPWKVEFVRLEGRD